MSFFDAFGEVKTFKNKQITYNVGDPEFDLEYIRLKNSRSTVWVKVPAGWTGRPDLVSNEVFGTPEFWPEILAANTVSDPFEFKGGSIIKIPNVG